MIEFVSLASKLKKLKMNNIIFKY